MNDSADTPACRVRLTEDAVQDLHRIHRRDPQFLRSIFAKMILLERSTAAGQPLVGALVGFSKLTVDNRDWRIICRQTQDESHSPVLEITEVWAAGAPSDAEIYREMRDRVDRLTREGHPTARPLTEIIQQLGQLDEDVQAHPEPEAPSRLPDWLAMGLRKSLGLTESQLEGITEAEAQQMLTEHWSHPQN